MIHYGNIGNYEVVIRYLFGGALYFNYKSDETLVWDTSPWIQKYGYKVHYPDADGSLLFVP